jgi:hypothetical protein
MFSCAYFAEAEVGHGLPYWIFTALCLALLLSIRIGRLSWFYTFMVIFFVLGCWLKLSIHHMFDYPYVEPTGNFGGLDGEWNAFYSMATVLGLGLLGARVVTTVFIRSSTQELPAVKSEPVPPLAWVTIVLVAGAFYTLNNQAGFFITGVESRIALPFGLNAPFAFMALIGYAVVVSAYLARDVDARKVLQSTAVLAILTVALIASVSMASRAAIVMQAMPMLIAATYVQSSINKRSFSLGPYILFSVFLFAALLVVSIYRINVFSGSSTNNSELVEFYALESVLLVFDRWIGMEAIMVAVSEPTRSLDLTLQLLFENPAMGTDSIYQLLSGSRYEFLQGLVFLTLPGYFGIIALSGSLALSFIAVFVLTAFGVAYERVVSNLLFGRTICVAVIAAALSNALAQLSFPRLLVPFVFQMTALVLVLHVFLRPPRPQPNWAQR